MAFRLSEDGLLFLPIYLLGFKLYFESVLVIKFYLSQG